MLKNLSRFALVAALLAATAPLVAQEPASPKPEADTDFSNECLALSYRAPNGWKLKEGKGTASSPDILDLVTAHHKSAAGSRESIAIKVMNTHLKHPNMERFVTLLALSSVHQNSQQNKITRNAYEATVAGRGFYRADLHNGEKFVAILATWYRGYPVVADAIADSSEDLEDAVGALSGLTFGEDRGTADCFATH